MRSDPSVDRPSLLLLGSKPGSVVALEVAVRRGWNVRGVVVSKREPHPWLPGERLGEAAIRLNVPVFHQGDLLDGLRADLVVSYMFRHRVRASTLARADLYALNFHAAPLPEYGGWAFYNVAIIENATHYGCTCHHMDAGFDTGELCVVRRFAIDAAAETAISLECKAQLEMIDLFVEVLARVEGGERLPRETQDPRRMRYLDRTQFEALKLIPPDANLETIDRTARAFFYPPYEGARLPTAAGIVEVLPTAARHQLGSIVHGSNYDDLVTRARDKERELAVRTA